MSEKEIKARWRRFVKAWGKGWATYTAALDELFATNFVAHGLGEDIHGLNDFKQSMSATYKAIPDFHGTIDDIIVKGNKVVMRYTMGGTHKGEYMGNPPTNNKLNIRALSIDRVAGSKIVESWIMYDTLSMAQQLGAVPTPKK